MHHTVLSVVWIGVYCKPTVFEEIGSMGPLNCNINSKLDESLLQPNNGNTSIAFMSRRTHFMQDGASPHIAVPVIQLSNSISVMRELSAITFQKPGFKIKISQFLWFVSVRLSNKCCIQWPDCKFSRILGMIKQHIHYMAREIH